MLPTLESSGTSVLISKFYRRGRGIEVGDMVSFTHPIEPEFRAIKRVIGMPGDFVLRDTPGKGDGMMIQVRWSAVCHAWLLWLMCLWIGTAGSCLARWRQFALFARFEDVWAATFGSRTGQDCCGLEELV